MLVLSRQPGESIVIGDGKSHWLWLITVLKLGTEEASLRIRSSDGLDSRTANLVQQATVQVDAAVELTLVDVIEERDRVRLGIVAPAHLAIHRQEIWEALFGNISSHDEDSGTGGCT